MVAHTRACAPWRVALCAQWGGVGMLFLALRTLLVPSSDFSVVVLAVDEQPNADVAASDLIERLVIAGVSPQQILLHSTTRLPRLASPGFYSAFVRQPGIGSLERRNSVSSGRHELDECLAVASAADQLAKRNSPSPWVIVIFDDWSLRLQPGAGKQLGAKCRFSV